ELLHAGYDVVVLDNLCNSRRSVIDRVAQISGRTPVFIEGDIRDAAGVGFVRPHDLDVERYSPGAEGIVVQLRRSHAIGPLAQLELDR
ncbi:hypothetical protein ABTJ52_20900, partial [Acinetobacter baumannii]